MKVAVLTRLAISPFADRDLTVRRDDRDMRFRESQWLKKRAECFLRFPLAGMTEQVLLPDLWLLAVDERSAAHLRFVENYLPAYARLTVMSEDELFPEIVRRETSRLSSDLLTIRLDADDWLHPRFISLAAAFSKPNHAINFPHGAQYFESTGEVAHRWIQSNPMVGFRSVDTDVNVHDFGNHPNVGRTVRTITVPTVSPMWVKIAHSSNAVSFQPIGLPFVFGRRTLSLFEASTISPVRRNSQKFRSSISYAGFRLNKRWPRLTQQLERLRTHLRTHRR